MTDRELLLAAVEVAGTDTLPRLVYADWVEEGNGDEADRARVAMIRTMTAAGMTKKQTRARVSMLLAMNWRLLMPRLAASGRQVEVDVGRCCLKVLGRESRYRAPDVQIFVDGDGMLTSCRYADGILYGRLARLIDDDLVGARHLPSKKPTVTRHIPGDSRGRVVPITGQPWYCVFLQRSSYPATVAARIVVATDSGYSRDILNFSEIGREINRYAMVICWAEKNTKKSGDELASKLYHVIGDCMTAAVKAGDDLGC